MTVSKAFWKIVLKNISTIIMYTVILVSFGTVSAQSSATTVEFEAVEPSIVVFNHDGEEGITKNLVEYLDKNAEIKTGFSDDDKLKDALFYEEVVLVVDIPENYSKDYLAGKNPEISTRSSAGYQAELAKVMLRRYLSVAQSYSALGLDASETTEKINAALESSAKVEVLSKVDSSKYAKASAYFSFANYAILACVITIICLIMSSFNRMEIRKRNLVSSVAISKMNRILLRNSCLYAFGVWLMYMIFGYFMAGGDVLFSNYGILFAVNSFIFCIVATTIAYLISQLVQGRNAVNGIMNVVALGSSFLCGAFVPLEFLPESVKFIAHALPSFYYIDSNYKIQALEGFSLDEMAPVLINMGIMLGFAILFVILANIIAKRKQRVA